MKKNVLASVMLATLLICSAYFISCKKTVSNSENSVEKLAVSPQVFAKLSPQKQANILANDADWKTIVDLNTMFMDKVVNSKQSFDEVSLQDEEKVLEIIGMSKAEYMEKVSTAKLAANRLLKRYNLNSSLNNTCATCGIKKNETDLADFKKNIKYFKANKNAYEQQKKSILGTSVITQSLDEEPIGEIGGDSPSSPCCGGDFYICVTICAATIEAFPIYLGCTYLCFKSYCCKS